MVSDCLPTTAADTVELAKTEATVGEGVLRERLRVEEPVSGAMGLEGRNM